MTHQWGSNNFLQNVYYRVADGTESGSVSITHPDSRMTSALMVCLRGNQGGGSHYSGQFDGAAGVGRTTSTTITAPSLTPTAAGRMLFYFVGVDSGTGDQNYSNDEMCLLRGINGETYTVANQAYAEIWTPSTPTGSRSWTGGGSGWRSYSGGLIPWAWSTLRPTVGYIGLG